MITTAEWLESVRPLDPITQRDELHARNAAIFASSTAQPCELGEWKRELPPKKVRERAVHAFIIHIAPQMGEVVNLKALCGSERGRACKDPTTTQLVLDRYCSRCWNRWAKEKAGGFESSAGPRDGGTT